MQALCRKSDGTLKWSYATGASDYIYSSPAVGSDSTVYVGADDSELHAIRADDGTLKWSYATGDRIYSSPAIGSDGSIYFGSADKKVYAIKNNTGTEENKTIPAQVVLLAPTPNPSAEGSVIKYGLPGKSGCKPNPL